MDAWLQLAVRSWIARRLKVTLPCKAFTYKSIDFNIKESKDANVEAKSQAAARAKGQRSENQKGDPNQGVLSQQGQDLSWKINR